MNNGKWFLGVMSVCLLLWMILIVTIVLSIGGCSHKKEKIAGTKESEQQVENIILQHQEENNEDKLNEKVSMGTFLLTAYCPCYECSEGYSDITATGKRAKEGRTIAVDPNVIEYGTTVYIEDVPYIAEDCGGLVKGKHIDIYFDSHDKVDAFGKKYAEVEK